MDRTRAGKWARRVVWGALAAVMAVGCNPLNLAAFMFARDEKIPAPYPLTFDKDGPKKDKEEVVVVLLPYLAPGTAREFVTADRELAEKLSKVLPEMAKENKDKKKVRVVSPAEVDKFKVKNSGWKQMTAGEIGRKLGADYVLEIELSRLQLYQPNTGAYDKIYEGRGEAMVSIYEVGPDGGALKDSYPLTFVPPKDRMMRPASSESEAAFRQKYIEAMAVEIAMQHVDHRAGGQLGTGGP